MFKINNKNTKTTSSTSTYFIHVSIVHIKQVNFSWICNASENKHPGMRYNFKIFNSHKHLDTGCILNLHKAFQSYSVCLVNISFISCVGGEYLYLGISLSH